MTEGGPVFNKDDFVLRERGRKFEDFEVGQRFQHHWGRTIGEADNVAFSAATCNWSPLYLNREYAASEGHPLCPINPSLVVCVVLGLSVEDLSEVAGPFLGMSECSLEQPVYPGDTITVESVVLACRMSSSRTALGIVTWRTVGVNQRGEAVVRLVRSNLVEMRSRPESSSDATASIVEVQA